MDPVDAATDACRGYERWAAEEKRLTDDIAAVTCPRAEPDKIGLRAFASCFQRAKSRLEDEAREKQYDPDWRASDWPGLEDIAREVADCDECSRLCELISERRHARKRWGVAKRAVRRAGKLLGQRAGS